MTNFKEKIVFAKKIIKENINKYPNCAVATSFGKDSMVLLDLVREIKKDILVFSVLANTEFDETLKLRDEIIKKWNLNYKEYTFVNDPNNLEDCCRVFKVEKFKEAVKGLDMWFSGIRRDEGITRENFQQIEEKGWLIKINPILYFTEKDIWRYLALYEIPVNPLYREGYRSLSCRLCSAKEKDENESERAGRWQGTCNEGGECGIHSQQLK